MCVCMLQAYVYACVCCWGSPEEGVRSPSAGVTGVVRCVMWVLGTELWFYMDTVLVAEPSLQSPVIPFEMTPSFPLHSVSKMFEMTFVRFSLVLLWFPTIP